jgi:hypothetical protein
MRPLPWLRYPNPTIAFLLFAVALAQTPTARPAAAQAHESLPVVTQIPASTRAMALGDAYMMNAAHADAIFYHPALLAGASGFGLDVQSWGGSGTAASASAALPWLGGGVALGVQTLTYGTTQAVVLGDVGSAAPGGQDVLFDGRTDNVSEWIASLGYAREVLGIDVGVVGKLVEAQVFSSDGSAWMVDVGVAREVGPLTAGLAWRNLGQSLSLRTGTFGTGAPDRPDGPTLGVGGYGRQLGPLDVGLAGSVSYVSSVWLPSAGVEVGYWPIQGRTFVGRIGVQRVPVGEASPFSFGFAFWGDDITLEWAFQPFSGGVSGGGTHRVGVRWR